MLTFADFQPGQSFELGRRSLTAAEIKAFAVDYDPQPFHTDEAAAAASAFEGLCASGWQTAGVFMRLFVDGLLHRTASMGSPGVDALRWLAPVRPGQELTGRATVEAVKPSRSRPDRGFVTFRCELLDAATGTVVFTMTAPLMIGTEG